MQQMEEETDGPHIEEVFDSPSRGPSVLRDVEQQNVTYNNQPTRIERQLKTLICMPNFNKDSDVMREAVQLMKRQISEWKDEQEYDFTEEREERIRKYKDRVDRFTNQIQSLEQRFFEEREERMMREEARRQMTYSQLDVTGRENRTKLYQSSSQRTYDQRTNDYDSSDEENMYQSRSQRRRSRSPTDSRNIQSSSNYQSRDNDNRSNSIYQKQQQKVRMRSGKSRVTKTNSRKWRPGQKALNEIRQYQKSTDLLIQKAPFCRLVHQIVRETTGFNYDYRIRADAIAALQEAAEAFLVEMFEGSVLISNHAKRVTLMPTDIQLYRRLCLRNF